MYTLGPRKRAFSTMPAEKDEIGRNGHDLLIKCGLIIDKSPETIGQVLCRTNEKEKAGKLNLFC